MDGIRAELREMKYQAKADFEFMAAGMAHNAKQMNQLAEDLTRAINQGLGEMSERMTQIEGRMRLADQRFGAMLDKVDQALDVQQDQMASFDRRITALEQRNSAA